MSYYNLGNHTAEIGIKICETEYQDKGLGRVLLSMLIKELFSRGYERIVLDTNLKNTRAQHVYETLGFKKVRIRENSWKNQVGEVQSSVDYELARDDFWTGGPCKEPGAPWFSALEHFSNTLQAQGEFLLRVINKEDAE